MATLAQTLGLTDVQQEIVSNVRRFVDKEVIPVASQLEKTDTYPQDIVDKMAEMGLFGLMIPEEYGGIGESLLTYALCVEELARGWMSVSGVINTHFIVAYMIRQHGTDEQKRNYLPRMAAGELRGAFSMSEPELGSDVAAIRTKARRDEDGHYRIDGQKMWLTNGGSSTLVAALVRTDEGAVSLLVDRIGDVMHVDSDSFERVPDTVTGVARDLILGAYKLPDTLLLVLDTDRIVGSDDGSH